MEEKKIEQKDVPPDIQDLIHKEAQRILAEQMKRSKVRQPPWIKRAWRELVLPKLEPMPAVKVKNMQDGLRFGMRCMMAVGGHKYAEGTKLTEVELQTRADLAVTTILNLQVYVLAAEQVITRHGLKEEYTSIIDKVNDELRGMYPQPTEQEIEKLRALIASGGENGQGNIELSDAGKGSERTLDSASLPDHQRETAES